jgi:hypothetical protein
MTQKQQTSGVAQSYAGGLLTCEFSQVNEPGLYVETQTGALVRIPEDAVRPNRSPALSIIHREPWVVTKISDDPFLSITKARMVAADLDLAVNF